MKRKHIALIIFSIISLLFVSFLFYSTHISQNWSTLNIEAGDELSQEKLDYIKGSSIAVSNSTLDTSSVNTSLPGTYYAYIDLAWAHFTYTIEVIDTTPPIITEYSDLVCLELGQSYSIYDIVDDITDNSSLFQLTVDGSPVLDSYTYNQVGIYTLHIEATDSQSNSTSSDVTFLVDTPPVITPATEYYISLGTTINPLEDTTAYDDIDGDLSNNVTVSLPNNYNRTVGKHQIEYQVTDSNGLTAINYSYVNVLAITDLEELIGNRTINRKEYHILGIDNLYDSGAYSLNDVAGEANYLQSVSVHLYAPINDYSWAEGSGFIIDITDEYLYICTCEHVTENASSWTAYFYDGTEVYTDIIYTSTTDDLSILAVPLEEVPEATLTNLMTVHIDLTYWNQLYTQPIDLFINIMDASGFSHSQFGTLVDISTSTPLLAGTYTRYDITTHSGNSGSAIIDGYGNLIGMVKFITLDGTTVTGNYAVMLPDIVNNYEFLTGNDLYTY